MIFAENNKSIEFCITGYEFPNAKLSTPKCYNHDANWLLVQIVLYKNGIKETYNEPCLLTSELEELLLHLTKVLTGEETNYTSQFTEPYLRFSIERTDTIATTIDFSHVTINGEYLTRTICSSLNIEQTVTILDELKQTLNKYPQR